MLSEVLDIGLIGPMSTEQEEANDEGSEVPGLARASVRVLLVVGQPLFGSKVGLALRPVAV